MSIDEEIYSGIDHGDRNGQRYDHPSSSYEAVIISGRVVIVLCAPLVLERVSQHTKSSEVRDYGQEEWIHPGEPNHQAVVSYGVQPLEGQYWLRQQIPPAESDES